MNKGVEIMEREIVHNMVFILCNDPICEGDHIANELQRRLEEIIVLRREIRVLREKLFRKEKEK